MKVTIVDDNGKVYSGELSAGPAGPVEPPVPGGPRLVGSYFTSDDLKLAVSAAKVMYAVSCDGETLAGGGKLNPPIRYGTAENGATVNGLTPDHPYFTDLAAKSADLSAIQREAFVPVAKALASAAAVGGDTTTLWETTPSTLDPRSMAWLLKWAGYTVNGKTPTQQGEAYRKWYYTTYPSGQVPGGVPHNPEQMTTAEIAALIAS